MNNITEILNQHITKPHVWMMPCAAVWLSKPVLTSKGNTSRIGMNDRISVKDGIICSDNRNFTHSVVLIKSTGSNSRIEIILQCLVDAEISSINLIN